MCKFPTNELNYRDGSHRQQPFVERRSLHLLATTQRTLWPLVKLLLHRGIGYPLLAEALKSVFVGVAESEFPLAGKAETDSRISLLTGIHRRDVKRLRLARRRQAALAVGFGGSAGQACP